MQNQCSCCQLLKDASTASAFGSEQRCSSAVSLFSSPIVTPRTACSDHNVVLVPMEKMPLGGTKREGIQGYPQYSLTLTETWMLKSMTGSLAASNSPCVAILCLGDQTKSSLTENLQIMCCVHWWGLASNGFNLMIPTCCLARLAEMHMAMPAS